MRYVKVLLVLPDLGKSKAVAIRSLAARGKRVDILVSYTILRWKPGMVGRLLSLRESGSVGLTMLDSGAYHAARVGASVDPLEYAEFASGLDGLWDLIVAPDMPGDPGLTLSRTRLFASIFPGPFVPVLQGGSVGDYLSSLEAHIMEGLLDRAPRLPDGRRLVGIGGLDGDKRRISFVAELLEKLPGEELAYHLFGAGLRILKGLRRRGLLWKVYSVDSTGWLAEIMYRRRTVYKASTTLEANTAAIAGYLEKAEKAVGAA